MERDLAEVTHADIEIEDHGWMVLNLRFEYDSAGVQGIGGYFLDTAFLYQVFDALGIHELSQAKGTKCWVTHDHMSISKIEPLMKKNGKPFLIKDWQNWVEKHNLNLSSSDMRDLKYKVRT